MHRISAPHDLLDKNGCLIEAGYATDLILSYDRKDIKTAPHRIKEWDYYLISNGTYAVALTIDDNSYMGLDSLSFLDFKNDAYITKSAMQLFTFGKKKLPKSSATGSVSSVHKKYFFRFENTDGDRKLTFRFSQFRGKEDAFGEFILPKITTETMVIASPFAEDKQAFYYNQKINCLPATGYIQIGNDIYNFGAGTYAVLDWGRGVWTYKNTWYWSSASGEIDGIPFGFNLGYGFADTSAASENMLFYNGKAHKLSKLTFVIPEKDGQFDYLSPWTFTSDDGRFEAVFTPILDRKDKTDLGIIGSDQHQVFGTFTGKVILDDGKELALTAFPGFAERVTNKW